MKELLHGGVVLDLTGVDEFGRLLAEVSLRMAAGHRNNRLVEVISGLSEGDHVLVHPTDRITDGVRVVQRETS